MKTLPGKDVSLWVATTPQTQYPALSSELSCDIAIVGGGIAGLMTAWAAHKAGLKTILIEKERLVEWTTGSTTAKLTSQHYLIYKYLIDHYGEETARVYGRANEDGIAAIEAIAKELSIDCDFTRRDAFVYTQNERTVRDIKEEVEAAKSVGLPASFETTTDLPFSVKGAIKFTNQAQFHPRKFLLGLAEYLEANGVKIFEHTEAVDIQPGSPHVLKTKSGDIKATHIVVATQYPFWKYELFDKHIWTKMSYALGVLLKKDSAYPQGMYITIDEPMRTIRSHPYKDGNVLIFGGESHELGEQEDNDRYYQNLLADVKNKFSVDKILYRWYAGDAMPYDRLPYIGEYPGIERIYAITGFRAWGLAWATAAADIILNKIAGKAVGWAKPFGLDRLV